MTKAGEQRRPDESRGSWRAIHYLLRWVVPESDREAFFGDLIEEWETMIRPGIGPRRAAWWLLRQALGSVPPLLRLRLEREGRMIPRTTIRTLLGHRLSDVELDYRLIQWVCSVAGVAIVPLAIRALLRHPGRGADFVLGVVLAAVTGLLILMLGLICRHRGARMATVPLRRRWAEFVGYLGCLGLMIGGIRALPALALSPVGITVAVLATCCLSLALLLSGMMTTLYQVPKRQQ